jgi:hypothetical protein
MLQAKTQEYQALQEKILQNEGQDFEDDKEDYEIELLCSGAVDVSSRSVDVQHIKEEECVKPREVVTFQIEDVSSSEYGSMRQDVLIEEPDDE